MICDFNIPWPTFWILLGLTVALLALWTLNLRRNDYSILDLFMEGEPRKASVNKHILIGFALLSVWLIIMKTLDVGDAIPDSVGTLLLGVLGIFVLGRAAGQAIHTTGQTITRKASINQGRDEGDVYLGSDRRDRTDDLQDERPPGMAKRSVMR